MRLINKLRKTIKEYWIRNKNEKVYLFNNVYTHNTTIEDYSYVSYNSIIHFAKIGKFCSIGPNVVIGFGDHPTNFISTSPAFYALKEGMFNQHLYSENKFEHHKEVTIGNDVWIGANVYVKNGVTIGDGAVIGAGAIVTKDIPSYAIAVGVPANVTKYRFEENIIKKLEEIKWWNWDIDKINMHKSMFVGENFHERLVKEH